MACVASLSETTVAAVEDACLRGEWTQALNESRRLLAARIGQFHPESRHLAVMTMDEERVLAVYLQAVFELDLEDEVETAMSFATGFAPCGVTIPYCRFLLAMNRRQVAKHVLQDVMGESMPVTGRRDVSKEHYVQAAEMMVLQFVLPEEGMEAARQFVVENKVLDDDDNVKLQLLRRIQKAAKESSIKDSRETLSVHETVKNASGISPATDATDECLSTAFTGTQQPVTNQDDDSHYYVVIGAIAVAITAIGALRYREKMYKCISNALPAIAKSVADAKDALFEA